MKSIIMALALISVAAVAQANDSTDYNGQNYKNNYGGSQTAIGSNGTVYQSTNDQAGSMVNTRTGEFMAGNNAGGMTGTRNGTFYAPDGAGGYTNTRTGEHIGN